MEHATRTKLRSEFRTLRIIRVFRLLFGVEVVEIAKKFVEPVNRRQKFVTVAKVIFAYLGRYVSLRLKHLRDGRVLLL